MSLAFLWLIILTIVCIVLGSNMGNINWKVLEKTLIGSFFTAYSSNSALSDRLDEYSAQHTVKISSHARLLKDLDQNHQRTAGRVEHVASQVGRLKDGVNVMEGRLRGEVKTKLEDVRSVLLTALSKAEASIKDIQEDVKKGIV